MADTEKQSKDSAKLSLKTSIFLLIACPLIVIILCSVTISVTAKKMVPDDLYSFDKEVKYEIEAPDTAKKALDLVDSLAKNVENSKTVRVSGEEKFRIDSVDGNLTDGQKGFISYMAQQIGDGLTKEIFSQAYKNCDFGEAPASVFDRKLLADATLFSREEGIIPEINSDNGELQYKLLLSHENSDRLFIDEEANLLAQLKKSFAEFFTVEKAEFFTEENAVSYAQIKADALKGELREIFICKPVTLSMNVNFTGSLAQLGNRELVLKCTLSKKVSAVFAGIKINNKEITVHKTGYDNLSLSINAAEAADAKLTFASSDPSVCTVDEKGMVEAVKESTSPVTVTATLEYLGETFTDTCTVWVITKTTGVEISKGEHTMKTGESFALSAKVQPKDATVQDIMWLSSDEKICTVNEKGEVLAVAPGEVLITAVTVQGHFMEACRIKVEG